MIATVYGTCAIVKKPELKHVGEKNVAVCKPFVVFERRYQDSQKEWQTEKCFIGLELWGSRAEQVGSLNVGDQLFIQGSLSLSEWTDNNDNKRSVHFIKVDNFAVLQKAEGKSDRSNNQTSRSNGKQSRPVAKPQAPRNEPVYQGDDIPF